MLVIPACRTLKCRPSTESGAKRGGLPVAWIDGSIHGEVVAMRKMECALVALSYFDIAK
jgi:hypothetical protein